MAIHSRSDHEFIPDIQRPRRASEHSEALSEFSDTTNLNVDKPRRKPPVRAMTEVRSDYVFYDPYTYSHIPKQTSIKTEKGAKSGFVEGNSDDKVIKCIFTDW